MKDARAGEGKAKPAEGHFSAPAPLTALVSYHEGAVVSRALLARPTGTVTLFAFDVGQALSEHATPFDALAHVLEGEADVTLDRKESRLRPCEAILLPARQPHALRAAGRFKMLLVMIRS